MKIKKMTMQEYLAYHTRNIDTLMTQFRTESLPRLFAESTYEFQGYKLSFIPDLQSLRANASDDDDAKPSIVKADLIIERSNDADGIKRYQVEGIPIASVPRVGMHGVRYLSDSGKVKDYIPISKLAPASGYSLQTSTNDAGNKFYKELVFSSLFGEVFRIMTRADLGVFEFNKDYKPLNQGPYIKLQQDRDKKVSSTKIPLLEFLQVYTGKSAIEIIDALHKHPLIVTQYQYLKSQSLDISSSEMSKRILSNEALDTLEAKAERIYSVLSSGNKVLDNSTIVKDVQSVIRYRARAGFDKGARAYISNSLNRFTDGSKEFKIKAIVPYTKDTADFVGDNLTRDNANIIMNDSVVQSVELVHNGKSYFWKAYTQEMVESKIISGDELLMMVYNYLIFVSDDIGKVDDANDLKCNNIQPFTSRYISEIHKYIGRICNAFRHYVLLEKENTSVTFDLKFIEGEIKGKSKAKHVYTDKQWSSTNGIELFNILNTEDSKVFQEPDGANTLANESSMGKIKKVPKEALRRVHGTQYGFIDPFDTPESQDVGLTVNKAHRAVVNEYDMEAIPFFKYDAKENTVDKEMVYLLSPLDLANVVTAPYAFLEDIENGSLPEQVTVLLNGEPTKVSPKAINYIEAFNDLIMSLNLASLPFDSYNAHKRLHMAPSTVKAASPVINAERSYTTTGTADRLGVLTARDILCKYLLGIDRKIDKVTDDVYLHLSKFVTSTNPNAVENHGRSKTINKPDEMELTFHIVDKNGSPYMEGIEGIRQFTVKFPKLRSTNKKTAQQWKYKTAENNIYGMSDIVIYPGDIDIRETTIITPDGKNVSESSSGLAIGQNVKVLFQVYDGWNYEDAAIIREGFALNYGLATYYTFTCSDSNEQAAERDQEIVYTNHSNDPRYNEYGLPKPGTFLYPNDVVIMRTKTTKHRQNVSGNILVDEVPTTTVQDIRLEPKQEGYVVDSRVIHLPSSDKKYKLMRVEVLISQTLLIDVGDKESGFHGNKSVVSVIIPDIDMPYDEDGNVPDIILNPLGAIQRENVGQIIEHTMNEVGRREAEKLGTNVAIKVNSCDHINPPEVCELAEKAGLVEKTIYNPKTGQPYPRKGIIGNMYLTRSTHIASSKYNACSTASNRVSEVDNQPVKGQGGGQSKGEMEHWAYSARGMYAYQTTLDTLQSDDRVAADELAKFLKHNPLTPIDSTTLRDITKAKFDNGDGFKTSQYGTRSGNLERMQAWHRFLGYDLELFEDGTVEFSALSNERILDIADNKRIKVDYAGDSNQDASIIKELAGIAGSNSYKEAKDRSKATINNNNYSYVPLPYKVIMPSLFVHDEFAKLIVYRHFKKATGDWEYRMASRDTLSKLARGEKVFCIEPLSSIIDKHWDTISLNKQSQFLEEFDNDLNAAKRNAFGYKPLLAGNVNTDGTIPGIFVILDRNKEVLTDSEVAEEYSGTVFYTNIQDFFQLLLRHRNDPSQGYYDADLAIYLQQKGFCAGRKLAMDGTTADSKIIGLAQFAAQYGKDFPGDPFAGILVESVLIPPRAFRAFSGGNDALKPAGTLSYAAYRLVSGISANYTSGSYTGLFASSTVIGSRIGFGDKIKHSVYDLLCSFAGLNKRNEFMGNDPKEQKKLDVIQGLKDHKSRNSLYRDTNLSKNTTFSGRSVIVPNPRLRIGEMGTPVRILTKIFENHLFGILSSFNHHYNNLSLGDLEEQTNHFLRKLDNDNESEVIKGMYSLYDFIITNRTHFGATKDTDSDKLNGSDFMVVTSCLIALANHNLVFFKSTGASKETLNRHYNTLVNMLKELTRIYPVELNRAPTLWRHGIALFKCIPCEGYAIQLHPLCCPAYNGDFDGDQMALVVPQHLEAIKDAAKALFGVELLYTQNAEPLININQDMVLGSYIATIDSVNPEQMPSVFLTVNYSELDVFTQDETAYATLASVATSSVYEYLESTLIHLNDCIYIDIVDDTSSGETYSLTTTVGRFLFNALLGTDGFTLDSSTKKASLAYDKVIDKKAVAGVVADIINSLYTDGDNQVKMEQELAAIQELNSSTIYDTPVYDIILGEDSVRRPYLHKLDRIKDFGFYFCKGENVGLSLFDFNKIHTEIIEHKQKAKEEFNKGLSDIERLFQLGFLDNASRKEQYIAESDKLIKSINDEVAKVMKKPELAKSNLGMIIFSGARGSIGNLQRICGIVGQVQDEGGNTVAMPVLSSYLEGLSSYELQQSAYTGRRSQIATQIAAPDVGEKTRQYVYLSDHLTTSDTVMDCKAPVTWINLHPNLDAQYIGSTAFLKPEVSGETGYKTISKLTLQELAKLGKIIGKYQNEDVRGYKALIDADVSRWLGPVKPLRLITSDEKIEVISNPTLTYPKHPLKMLLYRTTDVKALETYMYALGLDKSAYLEVYNTLLRDSDGYNDYYVVTDKTLDIIQKHNLLKFPIYTIIGCHNDLNNGICSRCFGLDVSTKRIPFRKKIQIGVDASQSLGQIGLQGTMDHHKNGVKQVRRQAEDILKKASSFGSLDQLLQKVIFYRNRKTYNQVSDTFKTIGFDTDEIISNNIVLVPSDPIFPGPDKVPYNELVYGTENKEAKKAEDRYNIKYRYIYNSTSEIRTLPSLCSYTGDIVRYEGSIPEFLRTDLEDMEACALTNESYKWVQPGWLQASLHLWEIFYSVKVSTNDPILARNLEIQIKSLLGTAQVTTSNSELPELPPGSIVPLTMKGFVDENDWDKLNVKPTILDLEDAIHYNGKGLTSVMFSDPKKRLANLALKKARTTTKSILSLQGIGNVEDEPRHSKKIQQNSCSAMNSSISRLPETMRQAYASIDVANPAALALETQNEVSYDKGFGEELFNMYLGEPALEDSSPAVEVSMPLPDVSTTDNDEDEDDFDIAKDLDFINNSILNSTGVTLEGHTQHFIKQPDSPNDLGESDVED